jgi:hypothetical protein
MEKEQSSFIELISWATIIAIYFLFYGYCITE